MTFAAVLCLFWQCTGPLEPTPSDIESGLPNSTILRTVTVSTDKSAYKPGDTVLFTADKSQKGLAVRYWHLGELIDEMLLTEGSWSWTVPSKDFQGYMVELVGKDKDGNIKTVGTVGVDVSSDWTRFPRYGFLSKFTDKVADSNIQSVIENLKDYHINGIQYYDWHMDHHHPLAGTPEKPDMDWLDIAGNENCYRVVKGYIDEAHKYNIASMFYDLCYGALNNASEDGVDERWYVFKDKNHQSKDYHPLNGWRSNIYLVDPNNQGWLDYFSKQVSDVYKVYDFDGFHIDQLGSRGNRYDYNGATINMTRGFGSFIKRMRQDEPSKKTAFNAVSRYGQSDIAAAGVDFLYNEVWTTGFDEIKAILDENHRLAPDRNTVLAAYMNYDMNPKSGDFNTSAVLLADAVIFAMGGDHLELGEHMLCSEYFPATNLSMSSELKSSLRNYYDFLTGYENILRDGVQDNDVTVTSDDMNISKWGPSKGSVNYITKTKDGAQVIHLLNFKNATHLDWRDDQGTQAEPKEMKNVTVKLRSNREVSKVWVASPDYQGGAPVEVAFREVALGIVIDVPYLKYWTMIVVE